MAYGLRSFICEWCGRRFQKRRKIAAYCDHKCAGQSVAALRKERDGWEHRPCSLPGCTDMAHTRGICVKHRMRMDRTGSYDVSPGRRPDGMSVHDWFMSKVRKDEATGCWVWTGQIAHKRGGYGVFYDADCKRKVRAHHFLVPPIPQGGTKMEYDHLCHTAACVRPQHLELLTRAEHRRREAERLTPEERHAVGKRLARGRWGSRQEAR